MDIRGESVPSVTHLPLKLIFAQKVILLALRFPAARRNVQAEMGKAKLDIERKIIPRGAEVTRHLTLPTEGKSLEWILQEMDKMDVELGSQTNWRLGKLSGAVYRVSLFFSCVHYFLNLRNKMGGRTLSA